jgi:hypothetical protein
MFVLTQNKIKAFGEVSRDIGQVLFAAILVQPLISGPTNFWMVLGGALSTLFCFGANILLSDYANRN